MNSRHDPDWINLHPLWLSLARANVPGSEWTQWNQQARMYGVTWAAERVALEAHRERRDDVTKTDGRDCE